MAGCIARGRGGVRRGLVGLLASVAVALIDCDLGTPAELALDFLAPALQPGSVLILDDFFAYRGSRRQGVAGAFERFRARHPDWDFRRLFDYGHGGQGFILSGDPEKSGAPHP